MQNKAKKLSFSLFLCFIVGILTAISFVLSFSGAWFTSSKSTNNQDISLRFGTVMLGANFSTANQINNLVPTQTIAYHGASTTDNIAYAGTVNAYYRITFNITDTDGEPDEDLNSLYDYLYFYNVSNTQFNDTDNKCVYGSVEALGAIPKGEVKFDKTADNNFVNLEFKIQFKVDLIQSNNLDDIDDLDDMSAVENYQALFTYYDGLNS